MDRPDSSNLTSVSMRPRTAQSRPMTARPTTAASAHEASYVVALLEGRGVSREVGLAALDKDTGSCVLVQVCPCALAARDLRITSYSKKIADCQTYVKTLHQLHLHPPLIILVPDTFLLPQDSAFVNSASGASTGRRGKGSGSTLTATSLLVDYVREEFPCAAIEPVGRKYWNDAGGPFFTHFWA